MLCFFPIFWLRDINIYLVFSVFTWRPTTLLASNKRVYFFRDQIQSLTWISWVVLVKYSTKSRLLGGNRLYDNIITFACRLWNGNSGTHMKCRFWKFCVVIGGAGVTHSVQCLITDWTAGFDPRQRQRIFPLTSASRPALGPTQPPVQWAPGGSFPGGKARPGRDANHSPPSSAEVKKE
jgi:hypothetical protein